MKNFKKAMALALAVTTLFLMSACGSTVAENTVFSAADMEGKTIGVQLGTTGDELVTDTVANAKVERFNKGNDAIQALKQGKVDCVVIDSQPAQAFIEKNVDLMILEDDFALEEYAMCISKDNTELKDKINAALEQLKENGTLEQIAANYIGDEKGQHPYVSPEGIDRSNGKLVMATNAAFEPYEYFSGGKIVGFDPDMVQAVCDILGMELVIEDMEFDAIISAVQSGKADIGAAGMTITEDRLISIDFTIPYTNASQVIIVRK